MKTKKLFLSQILPSCPKIQNQKDWITRIDAILELSREDVFRLLKSDSSKYVADFDYFFGQACEMFKETIVKPNLRKNIEIFEGGRIEDFAAHVVSRIKNLIVSLGSNPAYIRSVIGVFRANFDEGQDFQEEHFLKNLEIDDFLQKIDEDKIKEGLKKAYQNGVGGSIDLNEAEYLCQKYSLNLTEILGYDPYETTEMGQEQAKSGNFQLVLIF